MIHQTGQCSPQELRASGERVGCLLSGYQASKCLAASLTVLAYIEKIGAINGNGLGLGGVHLGQCTHIATPTLT